MINLSHILEDLAKIPIKTGVLKLSFYFLEINKMTSSNIYIMKYVNLNFCISAESNQGESPN